MQITDGLNDISETRNCSGSRGRPCENCMNRIALCLTHADLTGLSGSWEGSLWYGAGNRGRGGDSKGRCWRRLTLIWTSIHPPFCRYLCKQLVRVGKLLSFRFLLTDHPRNGASMDIHVEQTWGERERELINGIHPTLPFVQAITPPRNVVFWIFVCCETF